MNTYNPPQTIPDGEYTAIGTFRHGGHTICEDKTRQLVGTDLRVLRQSINLENRDGKGFY